MRGPLLVTLFACRVALQALTEFAEPFRASPCTLFLCMWPSTAGVSSVDAVLTEGLCVLHMALR